MKIAKEMIGGLLYVTSFVTEFYLGVFLDIVHRNFRLRLHLFLVEAS